MDQTTRRDFLAASVALAMPQLQPTATPADQKTALRDLTLWYDKPATQWVDALPIGNGRLGAMVFGGGDEASPAKEILQLNEDTLWSGSPRDGNNRDAKRYLPEIRRAVLEEHDYHRGDQLCRKMQGLFAEAYQPLGTLRFTFQHPGEVNNYRRELNLETACARTSYTVNETRFDRLAFVSAPDQVVVVRVTASVPGQLNCTIALDGPLKTTVSSPAPNRLLLTGKAAAHVAGAGHPGSEKPVTFSDRPGEGMCFAGMLEVQVQGGKVDTRPDHLEVKGAPTPSVLLSGSPGYRGWRLPPDAPVDEIAARARPKPGPATKKSFKELQTRQQSHHK